MAGGVPERLPFVPTVMAQLASSFVNRVTPANVGGMALNVRFMQKSGVDSGAAVTGMGLNVVAGAIVHLVLLVVFFAWAGQSSQGGFAIPSSSKLSSPSPSSWRWPASWPRPPGVVACSRPTSCGS